jgi:hypothetical protein
VSLRDFGDQPLAAQTATAQPGHLVEVPVWSTKMGFLGSKPRLRAFPVCTCDANVLAVLFGGVQAFFESHVVAVVEPPHRTGAHPDATRTHRSRPRISSSVKSGSRPCDDENDILVFELEIRWACNASNAGASSGERLPPISLVSRHRSGLPPVRNPPYRRTRAYLERRRSSMAGRSWLH